MQHQPISPNENANNYADSLKPRTIEPTLTYPNTSSSLQHLSQNNFPLTPPSLQDNFQLLKLLDESIAKKQYLAKNIHTNEKVQIDILYISQSDSWDTIEKFRKTTKILQDLDISGIARILDFIDASSDPEPVLIRISEYHEAETLETLLYEEKRFSIDECRKITFSLLETLKKLHAFTPPLIHRNIKPSSILITNDNRVLLTNFENVLSSYDVHMDPDNDKGFYAPEHLTGNSVPESDYFSTGATILTLITRKLPHRILKNIYQNDSIRNTQIKLEKVLEDNLPTHFKPFKKTLLTLLDPSPRNRILQPQTENIVHDPTKPKTRKENTLNNTLANKPVTSLTGLKFAGQRGSYQFFQNLSHQTPRQIPEPYEKKWNDLRTIQRFLTLLGLWTMTPFNFVCALAVLPDIFSPADESFLIELSVFLFFLFFAFLPITSYLSLKKRKNNDYRYKLIKKGEKADAQIEYSPDDDCYYYIFKTPQGDFVKEKFFLPENSDAPDTIGILYDHNQPSHHIIYPFPLNEITRN